MSESFLEWYENHPEELQKTICRIATLPVPQSGGLCKLWCLQRWSNWDFIFVKKMLRWLCLLHGTQICCVTRNLLRSASTLSMRCRERHCERCRLTPQSRVLRR